MTTSQHTVSRPPDTTTLIVLEAYYEPVEHGMYRYPDDGNDVPWRMVQEVVLTNNDVYRRKSDNMYWMWHTTWHGPFTTLDIACVAAQLCL